MVSATRMLCVTNSFCWRRPNERRPIVKKSFDLPEDLAERLRLTAELSDRSQTYIVREVLDVSLPSLASLETLLEKGEELTWPPGPPEPEPEPDTGGVDPATGFMRDPRYGGGRQ